MPAPTQNPPAAPPPTPTPPPGVNIIGLKAPKPPPPPKGEIHLGARDSGPAQPPPQPGTPKERLFRSLREKAGVEPEPAPTPPPEPESEETPGMEDVKLPAESGETKPEAEAEQTPPETGEVPKEKGDKGKKVNPWKLIDTYKTKLADLEKKLVEKGTLPEQEKQQYVKQIEDLTKRNKELEDEMRFVDFSKSDEFKANFDLPYQKAWQRAVSEMAELTILDGSGKERPVSPQDILELVNLPLKKAREWANDKFGDFADDAMQHRKEIKTLFAAREQALTEARAKGSEREKSKHEAAARENAETTEFIKEVWTKANEEATKLPELSKYFTPTEGDNEGNEQLQKGFALVDQGFSEFAKLGNKDLPREEKIKIIKRHVAIRNRAAAFGRLVTMLNKALKQNEALAKEVSQFKKSEPPSGPSAPASSGQPAAKNVREEVFGALRKLAH